MLMECDMSRLSIGRTNADREPQGTMLLIAIVLGTTWLQLPLDSPSTFTRGGLMFISLLVQLIFVSLRPLATY